MGIRLTEDEAWERIGSAHTAIVTTLRSDGWPVALPIWFVAEDRQIYLRTPRKSKKVTRISRDPRASFLIESGLKWVELTAVQIACEATIVTDPAVDERITALSDEKYLGFSLPQKGLSGATKAAYAGMTTIHLRPVGAPVTWDNSRITIEGS